jgi:tetratricopeptide (TPR) repeat protein
LKRVRKRSAPRKGVLSRGLARFEAGAAAEAEDLFERLVARRPEHADAHHVLASVRHWRGERPGAILAYGRALAIDPTHLAALVGLARALSETGDHAGALRTASVAAARAPDGPSAQLALASAKRGLGDVQGAAEAFAKAAELAPNLAAAHVGEALARADLGEALAAEAAALRGVTLEPNLADAWFALGVARRGLYEPETARRAFERAIALDPSRAVAHLNLGLALIDLEEAERARTALERALELDPTSAAAHANLSSLFILAGRRELAKSHAQRALELNHDLMSAHQNLAALLAEEQRWDDARAHRDLAYGERNLVITTAVRPLQRVLILTTTESGNTPDRHLIPPAVYTRLLWFIEYASERQMAELPAYDVAFNAIGDEDLAGPTAANAARFVGTCRTRLLNSPERIALTRRDRTPELLAGIDGLATPEVVRLEAAELAEGVGAAARRAGIEPPFLVRPIGSHGGKGLALVEPGADALHPPPALAYYLTAFRDFRSPDGLYRKYRVIFVDGEPLPYHLAIADNWLIHYEHAGMQRHPDRLAEELRFLQDPARTIGAEAMAAVTKIGLAMGLDYAGVDFGLLPDGQVLVFEANATMLAHPEAPGGPLAHKNPAIEKIFAAFRAMLAKTT